MSDKSHLAVIVDEAPLPDEEARALWIKFSEHMDEHRGDMAGFAKLHGYVSVAPEVRKGEPVLVVRTTAAPPPPPQKQKPSPKRKRR